MKIVEVLLEISFLIVCIIATATDWKEGVIYNKMLLVATGIAVILNGVYYSFFARQYVLLYLCNVLLVILLGMFLFYTHSFAGGDCKLAIALAFLYPARYYVDYAGMNITLFFSIGFAILWGYLFLLGSSVKDIFSRKAKLSVSYVKEYLMRYVKSFVVAMIYIMAINLVAMLLSQNGISVSTWILRFICMGFAMFISRKPALRNKYVMGVIVVFDVGLSIFLKVIPFSIHLENYFLVIILLICQMTISTGLYEIILIDSLKQGMILSMGASVLMQNSRVRGLPGLSTEDLQSRLSCDEVESIKRWGKGKEIKEITIVKKVPFAIFLCLGFLTYFIIWSVSV